MFNQNRVNGKTALITGATSGIGRSCAVALAKLRMNIIIIGRRENLLDNLKSELEDTYSIKVFPVVLDVRNFTDVKDKLSTLPDQ